MVKKLKEYNKKRDFTKTKEPTGKLIKSKKHLKFVIQHHLASTNHYDFRLEWQGTMLSWAVPKGPSCNPSDKRLAVKVEDHPLNYRNFEGTIPKGQYGGGIVMIWDEGAWELIDVDNQINDTSFKFILKGKRLKGKWALIHMKEDNWLLIKDKDEFAKDNYDITQYNKSIRTNKTMKQIEKDSL